MNEWQFVIHQKALEAIDGLRPADRREIRKALRSLVTDPWQLPAAEIRPPNDRIYLVKKVGSYYLIYWVDEFSREVRLVRIDQPK